MSVKTPGSLGILQYVKEVEYGRVPQPATMLALGFMRTGTADHPMASEDIGRDGARVTGSSVDSREVATLTADLTLFATQTGHIWSDIIPLAIGDDLKGVKDVPSASYLVKVAKDEYFMLNGGVFDKLVITADKVGGMIIGKVDIKGQILPDPKPKVEDWGSITEAKVEYIPIIYNAYPKISYDENLKTIPSHKFTYTLSNNLVAQPGFVGEIASASGNGFVPGLLKIELEYEITSTDDFWDKKKLNGWHNLDIKHKIGGKTLIFRDCDLESGLPSRSQQVYNETLKFKCHGGIEVV